MAVVISQLKLFLEKTSVKGVPRIFKTETNGLKTLWIVSVIMFFTCCLYQLYISFSTYLSYETASSVYLDEMDLIPRSTPLPRFSLCNLNPTASQYVNKKSTFDLFKSFNTRLEEYVGNLTSKDQKDIFENEVFTDTSFFQFANEKEIQDIAIQKDNFILNCHLYKFDVPNIALGPSCEGRVIITKLVTANLFNCYTLRLPKSDLSGDIYIGISLSLYLDNLPQKSFDASHQRSDLFSSEGKFGTFCNKMIDY